MRRLNPLIALLIPVLAVTGWWIYDRGDTRPSNESSGLTTPAAVQKPEISSVTELSEEGADADVEQDRKFARAITQVPPGNSDPDTTESFLNDINAVIPQNLDRFTRHNLEAAISGDLNAGLRVSRARKRCVYRPYSPGAIERRVAMRTEAVQHIQESGEPYPEHRSFHFKNDYPTETEIREDEEGWRDACRLQAELFNDELRKRLDHLAQQGHVVARYLYASWPPKYLRSADGFSLQQEWEAKAREYSLLNLDEGEIAGLLVFGQSYAGSSLFTRQDRSLSHALYIAAIDCGFTDRNLQIRVDSYLEAELSPSKLNSNAPEVLAIAEKLTDFCH